MPAKLRFPHRSILALASIVLTAASCKLARTSDSGAQYSFTNDFARSSAGREKTLFSLLEKNHGVVKVGILLAFPRTISDDDRAKLRWLEGQVQRAAEKWNEPLVGYAGWPYNQVKVQFVPADQVRAACRYKDKPGAPAGQRSWSCDRQDFVKIVIDAESTSLNWAQGTEALIFIGSQWNVIKATDQNGVGNFTNFGIIHEYGHMFGLGDTYRSRGKEYAEPIGQPNSLMGNAHPIVNGQVQTKIWLDELAADDRIAVRSAWDFYKTGGQPKCADGYVPGTFDSNKHNFFYCVPAGSQVVAHDGATADGASQPGTRPRVTLDPSACYWTSTRQQPARIACACLDTERQPRWAPSDDMCQSVPKPAPAIPAPASPAPAGAEIPFFSFP